MDEEPFLQLLQALDNPDFWSIYCDADKIPDKNLEIYKSMLSELIEEHEKQGTVDKRKRGRLLESLVNFMLNNSGNMYKVFPNFHTSTNEIDQIIVLSEKGKCCQKFGSYDFKGNHFLGECKNYSTTVGVTYVGKFCHLAQISASRLGVLFSYYGFSENSGPWSDGTGLAKKFHLSKEDPKDRFYIIDFNLDDFKKIANGLAFHKIIESKCLALETDTDYSSFITEHPAESELPKDIP